MREGREGGDGGVMEGDDGGANGGLNDLMGKWREW